MTCNSAILITEANHRFANSLQMIVSATNGMLRRGVSEPAVRRDIIALQNQILLLGAVNRSLCGPFTSASISGESIGTLCRKMADAFGRCDAAIDVDVGCEVENPGTIRALVLLVAELMTNALKHASSAKHLHVRATLSMAASLVRLQFDSDTGSTRRVRGLRTATEISEAGGGAVHTIQQPGLFRVIALLPS